MNVWVQTIMALLIIYSGVMTHVYVLVNIERRKERKDRLFWKNEFFRLAEKRVSGE